MGQDRVDASGRGEVARLTAELAELRLRLEEAEETIRAIREGEVDAFVVAGAAAGAAKVVTLDEAGRQYRDYLDSVRQAAVTVASDGTVLYANRAFAQAVQAPPEGVVGEPVGRFVAAASRPELDRVLARRAGPPAEVLLERGDGTAVPVQVTAQPYAGEPGVVCLVLTDLTDQRRLDEVVAAETLSRSILEQAVDAIVVGDTAGTLIRAGAAARRLCKGDPVGRPFTDAFPLRARGGTAAGPDPAADGLARALAGEVVRGREVAFTRGDGRRFDLLLSTGPLRDAGGLVVGFVATLTDISELRSAEHALREADRRKDEFLAMLAHELRNPLSAIGNAAQVARHAPDDRDACGWATEVIDRQVRQIGRLVDDLLDVSRISRGKLQLKTELVDARTVVERAVQVAATLMAEKGHELVVPPAHEPLPVEGDPARIEQVLINLLNNAAKYTDPGGRVTLSAGRDGRHVVFTVADTGIGIAPEKLPLVFDLFEQVEDSIARAQGGLGIGLTLVKSLAEMHRGAVSASSEGLGRGSTFRVRLPLAEGAAASGPEDAPAPSTGAGRRVLLVDDNVDSVTGLARLLRRRGFAVDTAHDGPAALRAAAAHAPDFALIDIGLPGMDGFQLARALRADPATAGATIVAISGYGSERDRTQSRDAGVDHHLLKPVDLDTLLALLDTPRG